MAGTQLEREWGLYFATLPAFERGAKSNLPAFVLVSGVSGESLALRHHVDARAQPYAGLPRERGPQGSQE